MRLPYLRKAAPDVLATARAQRWEAAEALRVLLAEEVTGRDATGYPSRKTPTGSPSRRAACRLSPVLSARRLENASSYAGTADSLV
jgi:hypothetical protein